MQLAVVEYARSKAHMRHATTSEIHPESEFCVIDVMPEQKEKIQRGDYGGTMRLGAYPAILKEGSIVHEAYKEVLISERHRHRYEVNPEFVEKLENAGLIFSGVSPDKKLMETMELPKDVHSFFVGTQFHPELQSYPLDPHPLFRAFIEAAIAKTK
jgi:CTP synthase